MKPQQRQSRIMDVVAREGGATVDALAEEFGVSAETIRRDLAHLATSGALQKVHGGARRLRLHAEGSFLERMGEDATAKQVIARKLAALVEPGDTLFIDTGTTTLFCAEALADVERLTVITNSVRVAQALSRGAGRARVFLLGGQYAADNAQTTGALALDQIDRFQADHAVLAVAGLDPDAGATDSDFDEAQIARAMMTNAAHLIVVAQAAKLGRKAAHRICRLDEIDVLVCDAEPDEPFRAALDSARVDIR